MKQSTKAPKFAIIAAVAASITAAAACGASGPSGPEYLGVCVDPNTGMRVADVFCGGVSATGLALDVGGYYFDYINTYSYTGRIPAVGVVIPRTVVVVHSVPRGSSSARGLSTKGGSASTLRTAASTKGSSAGGAATKKGSSSIVRGGFGSKSGSGSAVGRSSSSGS